LRSKRSKGLWDISQRLINLKPGQGEESQDGQKSLFPVIGENNLLVVLIHSVIPFLKFCVGQKLCVGFALNKVLQFTNVARPFPCRKPRMIDGEIESIFFCICLANFLHKITHQLWDVFLTFPQSRNPDRKYMQAVISCPIVPDCGADL